MRKLFGIIAPLAVAAGLCLTGAARAGTVTFDDRSFPDADTYQTAPNSFDEQGAHFTGLQFYFIPAGNPDVSFPTGYDSTFMETAVEPVVFSLTSGDAFDFLSLNLGLGDDNSSKVDTVTVTGTKAGCGTDCTVSTNLTVTDVFQSFSLTGFTDLSQISFGAQVMSNPGAPFPPQADSGYLAFDNLGFADVTHPGAVPEPAAWSLMVVGFGAAGALMRRNRRARPIAA